MSEGKYTSYGDLLAFYGRKRKECPKGVTLKLERKKFLLLQFTFPDTGKRSTKGCGVSFTEEGIIQALNKAHKVNEALKRITTSSEFWEWYELEILNKNQITNDLKIYRTIFEEIENNYWNGRNKNTKRKRSKDIPNDVSTFNRYYGIVFNKFTNWDSYPTWEELKEVLYSWEQGTKMFKDGYSVIKNIIQHIPNNKVLLEKLNNVDYQQTEFKEKQSISIDDFLDWHKEQSSPIPIYSRDDWKTTKESWLWVASMCVVYGLRPSEIAACKNLTESITVDKVRIEALNNPENKNLLLYIGDKTYFNTTIKTGNRICSPMVLDKELINKLKIQNPLLPIYKPEDDSKLDNISNGFSRAFRKKLLSYKCPVTQAYAFRHLSNQLGEKYGIPQEIRARMLGHSVSVNDSVYKKRSNVKTTVDLLTNYSKQPLAYDLAVSQLKSLGIDVEDINVKLILKVVYQLSD